MQSSVALYGRVSCWGDVRSQLRLQLGLPKGVGMTFKNALSARRARAREREAKRRRDLLEESVRTHLLPALIKQGFEPAPIVALSGPVYPEFLRSFPSWGKLIRVREEVVDLVKIQFSTYGRAAFRINACAVPKGGMMTPAGYRTAEECVELGVCDLEMCAHPRWFIFFSFFSLFSQGFWRFRSPVRSDYEKLALHVAGLFPELELALRDGKLGPHLRRRVMKPLPPEVLERIERLKRESAIEK
jgi:hypothetical protein